MDCGSAKTKFQLCTKVIDKGIWRKRDNVMTLIDVVGKTSMNLHDFKLNFQDFQWFRQKLTCLNFERFFRATWTNSRFGIKLKNLTAPAAIFFHKILWESWKISYLIWEYLLRKVESLLCTFNKISAIKLLSWWKLFISGTFLWPLKRLDIEDTSAFRY